MYGDMLRHYSKLYQGFVYSNKQLLRTNIVAYHIVDMFFISYQNRTDLAPTTPEDPRNLYYIIQRQKRLIFCYLVFLQMDNSLAFGLLRVSFAIFVM